MQDTRCSGRQAKRAARVLACYLGAGRRAVPRRSNQGPLNVGIFAGINVFFGKQTLGNSISYPGISTPATAPIKSVRYKIWYAESTTDLGYGKHLVSRLRILEPKERSTAAKQSLAPIQIT
jgi:hypothetical protein